ncbi:MAG: DUF4410 domain-containing protein [Thermodesulfovibrionales bacterium]|nr:DUF4410 domain-containing protein [Thermodesulfovibrionales bacterium]
MKRRFSLIILVFVLLSGCAGQSVVRPDAEFKVKGGITANVVVKTVIPQNQKEIDQIETTLLEKLKKANIFSSLVEKGQKADLLISVDIEQMALVSRSERFWVGAMAGRAKVSGKVSVIDHYSGKSIGSFDVETTSSGGTVFAGTTDDAIDKFTDEVVRYLVERVIN